MDIKDKLIGNDSIYSDKPEKDLPDDFQENKEEIAKADDLDIKDFVRKKKVQMDEKEKKKAPKEEPKEPVEEEPVQPLKDKVPIAPEEPVQEQKVSNIAKILTIYMTPDKVEQTKQALQGAVNGNYAVAIQAGIQITKENVEEVSSILKYLAAKGYFVVISGEHVEPIFHEPAK